MDPELEAFIAFLPELDLTDPVAARKQYAAHVTARRASDIVGLVIDDRTVPADPEVSVRIYRPHQARGAVVWMHGGGWVMGDLDTEHPWAARIAEGEFDPNRDEGIDYALRLLQARVPVELHQWPGTFHGSRAFLSAEVSQRQIAALAAALRRATAESR
ncbi:alpha/beta hydrolase fold domain-containing protein [Nocardia vinacea]|uniref:alpha/beta hydrolase fold domain-containing protein n=1 Tax=Nocardia vinacea TaxID=96468 RepID=UPI0033F16400